MQENSKSNEHFRRLVESATDFAIMSLNPEGLFDSWNTGAERLLGYSEDEALGQYTAMLFTPEDRERGEPEKEMRTALAEGRSVDERWHVRKDGGRFWASGVINDNQGVLMGYTKIMRDLTDRKQMEDNLQQSRDELERRVEERTAELQAVHDTQRQLLKRLVSAQEEERSRLSREMHAQMGQLITALLLGLANIKSSLPDAGNTIDRLIGIADELVEGTHRISFALRPTALDDLGLVPALRNYVSQWSGWNSIPVELEVVGWEDTNAASGGGQRLSPELETVIYRVTQEVLTNITRHARGATCVSIILQRSASEVNVILEDNGVGFDVEATMNRSPETRRLGLFSMQERAHAVGGSLSIESELGKGTSVFLRVPV